PLQARTPLRLAAPPRRDPHHRHPALPPPRLFDRSPPRRHPSPLVSHRGHPPRRAPPRPHPGLRRPAPPPPRRRPHAPPGLPRPPHLASALARASPAGPRRRPRFSLPPAPPVSTCRRPGLARHRPPPRRRTAAPSAVSRPAPRRDPPGLRAPECGRGHLTIFM